MFSMVKILVVGAGGIARAHVNALSKIDQAQITGIADVRLENAERLAAVCGAKAYSNYEQGLAEADMVYILTPPSIRKEIALKAIAAGKDIVMEKPIAIHLQDAEEMVHAANAAGVKFMVGFNHRFREGFIRLKDKTLSGELGEMISFWSQRLGMGVNHQTYNWRTDPGLLCGMTVESLSHDIDLIRWIAGEIVAVRAHVAGSRKDLPGFDDNAGIVFTLQSGASAVIHASWSSHVGQNSRGVIGTKGTAMVEGRSLWDLVNFRWKTLSTRHEITEHINDRFDASSYEKENRYFVECVRSDTAPELTGEDGLQALRISHAILASSKDGRVVRIPDDLEMLKRGRE